MQRLEDENGAVAVIVGLMLVVLLGMGVLVVDVGNLYWERRQLQNGADAAALGAAQDLVDGSGDAVAYVTARQLADSNNTRGAHVAASDFDVDTNSVTVTARTGSYDALGTLDAILAGIFDVIDYEAFATATASWGPMGGGTTIPIAICDRAWEHWTTTQGLPSGPPDHYLSFGGANSAPDATCTNPSYDTYSGGFGFLRRNTECRATTRLGDDGRTWVKGIQGNNPQDPPSDCSVADMYSLFQRVIEGTEPGAEDSVVLIPIFDAYRNSTSEFRLIGYGGFKLTGYDINGGPGEKRYAMTNSECRDNVGPPNNASCLRGYFTEFFTVDGIPSENAGDFGANVIGLTG